MIINRIPAYYQNSTTLDDKLYVYFVCGPNEHSFHQNVTEGILHPLASIHELADSCGLNIHPELLYHKLLKKGQTVTVPVIGTKAECS